MNFNGVSNVNDATSRKWEIHGAIDHQAYRVGVAYYNSKLYYLGRAEARRAEEKKVLQVFDLQTNTSQK